MCLYYDSDICNNDESGDGDEKTAFPHIRFPYIHRWLLTVDGSFWVKLCSRYKFLRN